MTDTGWYATFPSDCCHAISPDNGEADLRHLLVDLCCNPRCYRRMGRAGRIHVIRTHGASGYARDLLGILEGEAE